MIASKVKCSLCYHDISSAELRAHREEETRDMIEYTIEFIKMRHPEWAQNEPTCQLCWDYYRGLPVS